MRSIRPWSKFSEHGWSIFGARQQARTKFATEVRAALDKLDAGKSDKTMIADALMWSAEYLASKPAGTRRVLVCSDGLDEAPIDITRRVPNDAMKRLKASGLVPAGGGLEGARVTWIGFGGGATAKHVAEVKAHWTQYMEAVGAKVEAMQRPGI